jgi:DNA invertase Pin-like site-specific DNA recombinase
LCSSSIVVDIWESLMLYGYARVSTDKQENSAEAQSNKLLAYAQQSGLQFGGLFVDEDQSANKIPFNQRKRGRVLWDMLRPGDVVAFTKIDRVFRSMADAANTLATWKELGVGVRFLDMGIDVHTPAGELFFNQLAAFAQYESQMIGQRVREITAYLRDSGRPFGKFRPFGWVSKNHEFVPLPEERALGRMVVQMRDEGHSFAAIALHVCKKEMRKPPDKKGKRGYYGLTDITYLHRAAEAGFPKLPPRLRQAEWIDALQRAEKSHAHAQSL